jgi:predicted dehydrogenase
VSTLKIGIVGYGKMGQIRHSTVDECLDAEVVAICDPYSDMSEAQSVRKFKDYNDLLRCNLDAIIVSCTNDLIPDVAVRALEEGCHVFCEKPPGRNLADVEKIKQAADKHPEQKLKFGFNHRYHEAIEDAHRLVHSGRFGRVLWMRGVYGKAGGPGFAANWRNNPDVSGGGILLDQGIHMIDLFHNFVGDFDEYQSFVGRQYWDIPVEDNAFALMRNTRGQVAMLHSSATQWRHTFRLEIVLEQGLLSLNGILSSTMTYGKESLTIARTQFDTDGSPLPNPNETITYYDEDGSWKRELDEFVQAIKNDGPITVGTMDHALAAMKAVYNIYDASPNTPLSDQNIGSAQS